MSVDGLLFINIASVSSGWCRCAKARGPINYFVFCACNEGKIVQFFLFYFCIYLWSERKFNSNTYFFYAKNRRYDHVLANSRYLCCWPSPNFFFHFFWLKGQFIIKCVELSTRFSITQRALYTIDANQELMPQNLYAAHYRDVSRFWLDPAWSISSIELGQYFWFSLLNSISIDLQMVINIVVFFLLPSNRWIEQSIWIILIYLHL